MNQMNSGEQDLVKLDDYLDKYMQKIGVGDIIQYDVSKYLKMTEDCMRKLSPDECYLAAFTLKTEALYIQAEINKLNGHIAWAKARINEIISPELSSYAGKNISFDTQRTLAIKNNSAAKNLNDKILKSAERRLERLQYLPNNLKDISEVFLKYAYYKTNGDKNEKN